MKDIKLSRPAPPWDLKGKTIYFVDNGKNGAEVILKTAMKLLQKDFPMQSWFITPNNPLHQAGTAELVAELEENADAAVVAVGD